MQTSNKPPIEKSKSSGEAREERCLCHKSGGFRGALKRNLEREEVANRLLDSKKTTAEGGIAL